MKWYDNPRRACRGVDVNLFFPGEGEHAKRAEAKALCATCPVRTDCLDYALNAPGPYPMHGIWGGTSGDARYRMTPGYAAPRRSDLDELAAILAAAHARLDQQEAA